MSARGRKPGMTQSRREDRRRRVAELHLNGWTQLEISHELNISRSQVSRDLKVIERHWIASAMRDFDSLRGEQLAKIDRLEREYWNAWERSQAKQDTAKSRITERVDGEWTVSELHLQQRDGNPRYLEGVQRCIEQRVKILGLDAAKRFKVDLRTRAYELAEQWGLDPEGILAEAEQILREIED